MRGRLIAWLGTWVDLRAFAAYVLGDPCRCGHRLYERDVEEHEALEHAGDKLVHGRLLDDTVLCPEAVTGFSTVFVDLVTCQVCRIRMRGIQAAQKRMVRDRGRRTRTVPAAPSPVAGATGPAASQRSDKSWPSATGPTPTLPARALDRGPSFDPASSSAGAGPTERAVSRSAPRPSWGRPGHT